MHGMYKLWTGKAKWTLKKNKHSLNTIILGKLMLYFIKLDLLSSTKPKVYQIEQVNIAVKCKLYLVWSMVSPLLAPLSEDSGHTVY